MRTMLGMTAAAVVMGTMLIVVGGASMMVMAVVEALRTMERLDRRAGR